MSPWAVSGVLVVALAIGSGGCGGSCPTGRTKAENGTCVDPKVVDFVACIDHASGSERSATNGTKLSADVRTASVGVATAADFQQSVSTKILPATDAQGQRLLDMCSMHVFGVSAAAYPAAPYPAAPYPAAPAPAPTPTPGPAPVAEPGKVTGPVCASGWSLRECEQWAMLVRQAQSQLNVLNDECKSSVAAGFAFETFRGHFAPNNSAGLDNDGVEHAVAPISAVAQICAMGDTQRAAVRAKVKRIEARWGGAGKSTWAFSNGVLTGTINPSGESSFDYRASIRGNEGLRREL